MKPQRSRDAPRKAVKPPNAARNRRMRLASEAAIGIRGPVEGSNAAITFGTADLFSGGTGRAARQAPPPPRGGPLDSESHTGCTLHTAVDTTDRPSKAAAPAVVDEKNVVLFVSFAKTV